MRNLELKDFLDYKYISNLLMSKDSKKTAFVVNVADAEKNNYKSNIWVMDNQTKECRKLTSLNEEAKFLWLDDNNIIFPSMRDAGVKAKIEEGEKWTIYYKISLDGGEAEEFMRIPANVSKITPLENGCYLLTAKYGGYDIEINGLTGEERATKIAELKESKDYDEVDEIPFWSNGVGFTNKKRNRMYLYDGKQLSPLTDEYTNVNNYTVKDNKILFVLNSFTDKFQVRNGVSIYDMETKTTEVLTEQGKYSIGLAEFMGDKILVTASDLKDHGNNQNKNFYFLENGELELLAKHDFGFGSSVGSDCKYGGGQTNKMVDDVLYFLSTENCSAFIKSVNAKGEIKVYTKDNGSVDCFDTNGKDFYFAGLKDIKLQEVYKVEAGEEIQLTSFNEEILSDKTISKPLYIPFKNRTNDVLDGFIMLPIGYEKGKKYPAIIDIHGGPKTVYGGVFYHEMQVWANMGYFVFFCNPRGGDGKGDEFADIRGKYGTIDYDDLMDFTDFVCEQYPDIDTENIGVTGGSYGGFMTNWIIGHTNRFKCAVSQRSISNFVSKFGTTDIGYFFNADQVQATPWDNYDKLWWHSPLKYADKATTPTLFIHSEQDYRCWLPCGIQMFTALKYHGVESKLCMFKGENHELSRGGKPRHRVKRLSEMTGWFEKYLKN